MAELKPILLVEDNPRDLELTLAALERSQLANEVVIARDGVEAVDYLETCCAGKETPELPAVVLLDIKLPRMDGIEVLERIKRDPRTARMPVVMLTASREEGDLVRSYRLGVDAFVVKPMDFTDFLKVIQEMGVFWAIINEPPPGAVGPGAVGPGKGRG